MSVGRALHRCKERPFKEGVRSEASPTFAAEGEIRISFRPHGMRESAIVHTAGDQYYTDDASQSVEAKAFKRENIGSL